MVLVITEVHSKSNIKSHTSLWWVLTASLWRGNHVYRATGRREEVVLGLQRLLMPDVHIL